MNQATNVEDGQVVSLDYTLHVEGELVDNSDKGEPLEFIQGAGHIIPGLEKALYGMQVGESKKVVVAAKDGYGELDAEAFVDVPRKEFPPSIPLEIGLQLHVRNQDGSEMPAFIHTIGNDVVRLDFNHPLAGKELNFEVKVAGLRAPTEEELAHGHVHGAGHAH